MSQLQIKDFTLRDKMFGSYSWEEENMEERMDAFAKDCNSAVHPSLLKALNGLKPHVAVLMGWQVSLLKSDAGLLDNISIKGVDFGKGNKIAIKVRYVLDKLGYATNINIPAIDFALDVDNYPFMAKLQNAVKKLYEAVERYHNGEYGEGTQMELQLLGGDGTDTKGPELGGMSAGQDGNLSPI